jgi:hypothetical protein
MEGLLSMDCIEVPHDWGATRRSAHSSTIIALPAVADEEEPPQQRRAQPSAAVDRKRKHQAAEEDARQPPPAKCPLGPRSVFNAVTHDSPEKGQLKQMVIAQLTRPSAHREGSDTMDVQCLISKLPYQKMLSDLFMHQDKEVLPPPNLPYVTRAYEESFMREPLNSSERLCAKNELCECMHIDKENPFTAVEFLLPGEKPPETPHLCVVCCRSAPPCLLRAAAP